MVKVSLILTTYNCAKNLKRTLESIEGQDYPDIEVVIKDGGSTDGTVDVIRDYAEHSRYAVQWVSEKDEGIYDAMNKGFPLSTGEIVGFFNDRFCRRDAVSRIVRAITQSDDGGIYDGVNADLVYAENGKAVRYWKMGEGTIQQGWMPAHPTLYLRRSVYEKYGLYDSSYRCSADYEFMVRILKDKAVRLAYIPDILVEMYYGGTSSGGIRNYLLSLKEAHRALRENQVKKSIFIDIKRSVRVLKQFRMAKKVSMDE